jgi:hypothetical protein
MAKCGRCKKQIEIGSRCENCKIKDLTDRIKKRERKRKSTVFPDENLGKPVNVQFDNQGDILGDIPDNQTQQYPKTERSLGANAWGESNESSEPKPKSNQQRLKDLFGKHAES